MGFHIYIYIYGMNRTRVCVCVLHLTKRRFVLVIDWVNTNQSPRAVLCQNIYFCSHLGYEITLICEMRYNIYLMHVGCILI